ncbi:hypothetical protein EV363DRAFT_1409719 [Boletus edulis]|uniref:Uncharacterized protein n=1 Tax=Boletus edulis BED1 TaxID=1328754 RepID=A0AAD4G8P5_BOLED|nr:hypothetical protein EV363DRAFT_1409719 [Boletus edulis]KAF8428906.1 hypothetical protein L210DRAFT_81353 [Boletus edulis BED1]
MHATVRAHSCLTPGILGVMAIGHTRLTRNLFFTFVGWGLSTSRRGFQSLAVAGDDDSCRPVEHKTRHLCGRTQVSQSLKVVVIRWKKSSS